MKQQTGGIKRSSQIVFRRRLLLVRLLLRGPMTGQQLIDAVQADLGLEGYPVAAMAALKHDLHALKREYGCKISYRPLSGGYLLDNLGLLALLQGSVSTHTAIHTLDEHFPADDTSPHNAQIRILLNQLRRLASDV